VLPQAILVLASARCYFFLRASQHASVHNALLAMVSTRSRRSSGDAWVPHQARLIVLLLKGKLFATALPLSASG